MKQERAPRAMSDGMVIDEDLRTFRIEVQRLSNRHQLEVPTFTRGVGRGLRGRSPFVVAEGGKCLANATGTAVGHAPPPEGCLTPQSLCP